MSTRLLTGVLCLLIVSAPAVAVPMTAFDYGVATRGSIFLAGKARILGLDDPSQASVYSAMPGYSTAVSVWGKSRLAGDVYTLSPEATVVRRHRATIGGTRLAALLDGHIHRGTPTDPLPGLDTDLFEPFATNIVDANTVTRGRNLVFENIHILPNTNPVFYGNTTLRGVVFIEGPNVVTFAGRVDLTGLIVAEDTTSSAGNMIRFQGYVNTSGVEALPDEPQFAGLRTLSGTSLLAPGFSVLLRSKGNFSGAVAADDLTMIGKTRMSVNGPVVLYGDDGLTMRHKSRLIFGERPYGSTPAGFVPVPEPATLTMIVLGGVVLAARRRTRRR